MGKSIITSDIVRKSSDSFRTLYDNKGLQINALKSGKFEIKCGSTHTYSNNLADVSDKVDNLSLHEFPTSGQEVISAINEGLAGQYCLNIVAASKVGDRKEKIVHSVQGTKDTISDGIMGIASLNIEEMTPGKRYAMQDNMYGGEYAVLVPMVDEGLYEVSPSFEVPEMYEPQVLKKGDVLYGVDPKNGEVLTILVSEAYPNGTFKSDDGRIYTENDIDLYQLTLGEPVASEDFHEPDESLFESEDIPTYNPTDEVQNTVPMIGDLANYDLILSASAGVLSDFMKTVSKAAYLDRSSLNKIKVSAVNEEGQATEGSLEWNVRVASPYYERSSQIMVPMVMKAGKIELGKEFYISGGAQSSKSFPLTAEGLTAHLGALAEDNDFMYKNMQSVHASTINADKDIDSIIETVAADKLEEKKAIVYVRGGNVEDVDITGDIGVRIKDYDIDGTEEERLSSDETGKFVGSFYGDENASTIVEVPVSGGVAYQPEVGADYVDIVDYDEVNASKDKESSVEKEARYTDVTKLVDVREPSDEEKQGLGEGADVVFVREDDSGRQYVIYGMVLYESYQQWGEGKEILGDNVDDIQEWRDGLSEEDLREMGYNEETTASKDKESSKFEVPKKGALPSGSGAYIDYNPEKGTVSLSQPGWYSPDLSPPAGYAVANKYFKSWGEFKKDNAIDKMSPIEFTDKYFIVIGGRGASDKLGDAYYDEISEILLNDYIATEEQKKEIYSNIKSYDIIEDEIIDIVWSELFNTEDPDEVGKKIDSVDYEDGIIFEELKGLAMDAVIGIANEMGLEKTASEELSSKKTASLAETLNGAKLVKFDENSGLVYAWFGGTGVNIYDETGREVDYFSFSQGRNIEDIESLIESHISESGIDSEASKKNSEMSSEKIKDRLEYLRGEIEAERISYGEILELQSLADYIEPGDVLLSEWAGIPEEEYRSKTSSWNKTAYMAEESFDKWFEENKDSDVLAEKYDEISDEYDTMGLEPPDFGEFAESYYMEISGKAYASQDKKAAISED